ncbi:hypothetical protein CDAR_453431, partial [Caerostris darwini]
MYYIEASSKPYYFMVSSPITNGPRLAAFLEAIHTVSLPKAGIPTSTEMENLRPSLAPLSLSSSLAHPPDPLSRHDPSAPEQNPSPLRVVAVAATVVANRVHQANVCVVVECVPVYLYLAGEK